MTDLATPGARVPRDRFWTLPKPARPDGEPRRTGVEIEFSGLTEAQAADLVTTVWGGRTLRSAPHDLVVEDSAIGRVKIELDTALKDKAESALADRLLDLSREIVPVEIVTPPLAPGDLPRIDRLLQALTAAGAHGSGDELLLAFGIHLNPEVASETAGDIVPVVRAFGLLEHWLRAADPPDLTRRVLPFIDPWPRSFLDRLAEDGADWGLADLRDSYLEHVPTRNHGLDLLPLLEHLFPDRVRTALPARHVKGGRPTWHYRLPETGLGVADWSFAYEWNRWVLVERVAADAALLHDLSQACRAHRSALTSLPGDWAGEVAERLAEAKLWHD